MADRGRPKSTRPVYDPVTGEIWENVEAFVLAMGGSKASKPNAYSALLKGHRAYGHYLRWADLTYLSEHNTESIDGVDTGMPWEDTIYNDWRLNVKHREDIHYNSARELIDKMLARTKAMGTAETHYYNDDYGKEDCNGEREEESVDL